MTEMLNKEFSRRSFVKGGGALIVGISVGAAALAGKAQAADSPFASNGPFDLGQVDSFIAIHANNTASLKTGRIEQGNGITTGMLIVAAEELDMDLSQLVFVTADSNATPNTGKNSASAGMRSGGLQVRAAAAYAKQALLGLAAAQLGVPMSGLSVSKGIVSGGGRSVSYGALIGDKLFQVSMPTTTQHGLFQVTGPAAILRPGEAPAKSPSQYKLVGSEVPRVDIPEKVTGKFTYLHNVRVPGMHHARLVLPRGQAAYPSGAPVVSVDERSIRHIAGARLVRKGDFLAVVAPTEYAAIQAAAQLKVEWAEPPKVSGSANMFKQMREFDAAGQAPARVTLNVGNVDSAFAAAATRVTASYKVAYNGHLPIGPSAAVAHVTSEGALIFSSTQSVYTTRDQAATLLGLPVNKVRVVYYEGSSCYGDSPFVDAALGAALCSQLAGRPVRLQYMRWEEHGWDNHGSPLLADVRGAVDATGKIVAFDYTGFAQPSTPMYFTVLQLTGTPIPTPGLGTADTTNTGPQYALSNRRITSKSLPLFDNYFKLSPLRGVAWLQGNFATEQFIDELAHAARIDPLAFRRLNIAKSGLDTSTGGFGMTDTTRWGSVLDALEHLTGWQPRVAASNLDSGNIVRGRGLAIGGGESTMAGVAADVEVNKRTGKITVKDIWGAMQPGLAVYPEGIRNQMVGELVTGASRVLHEQVQYDTKRIRSLDWVTYPTLRFKDAPKAHVAIVNRPDLPPGGAGEATLIPVGAAIANAFFDATGVRLRQAPMTPARVRGVLAAAGMA
jgi:CO/xanthine dehydrogenase Mo-binding subunit